MLSNADVIYNPSTDAYFNLAAEEYLLDREDARPVFMLWRNADAVIIGRNQNAYAEINESFVQEQGVKVVRRLTGGGAVFHDLGNVNYTFIVSREEAEALDFRRFAAPIISALDALGAKPELSGRNDIEIGGRKVSGNAQCVRNGRIMHHGTLLWSSDPSKIAGALNVDPEKISAKGIKSVRSRVGNIKELIGSRMEVSDFIDYLFSYLGADPRGFNTEETSAIRALSDVKYSTWEWNRGQSKAFSAHSKARFPFGSVDLRYNAEGGVIAEVSITGDFFGIRDIHGLEESLRGTRLDRTSLESALSEADKYIHGAAPEALARLILEGN